MQEGANTEGWAATCACWALMMAVRRSTISGAQCSCNGRSAGVNL